MKVCEGYLYFEVGSLLGVFRSAHFVDEGLFLQYLVLGTEARCSSYLFCQPCVLNFGINAVFGWAKPAGESGLLPEDKLETLIKDRGPGDQSVHLFYSQTGSISKLRSKYLGATRLRSAKSLRPHGQRAASAHLFPSLTFV